ncbi:MULTISPECIES: diaminobutyrate acetyltransferase [Virgibacillus]|nr:MULTISPECIES: diaminobutyrate acetyltransferase [Virgibacillus]AVD54504.1 diaminobutyrate acetyltransferase [Priestia filamentosa]SMZ59271.1 RNA dependent RNA polymerase [Virgibacillus halodenitrificans]SMZ59274.1 RNA dependent RNA polymerase [Priestia endophytica]SMZ59276.1 RNA dependent RNA polymerase [Virgibacillus sp.]SMZ59278.1 RNA dependent RNA polymerase [Oceanobacillus sp.]
MTKTSVIEQDLKFRMPTKDDGAAVWELINEIGNLDLNSSYSYILWCDMFSESSIVVESEGETVGFISGFVHPNKPDTLFIWQVAVRETQRGKGLGTRMLMQLLEREQLTNIRYVEATVSPSNLPSQYLFLGLAEKLDTECVVGNYYLSIDFPRTGHEDEQLYKIGPFQKGNNE